MWAEATTDCNRGERHSQIDCSAHKKKKINERFCEYKILPGKIVKRDRAVFGMKNQKDPKRMKMIITIIIKNMSKK